MAPSAPPPEAPSGPAASLVARAARLPGVTRARRLLSRFVPPGAILLTVLTFGGYLMGLVRDRTFARTYGAGIELDAYNAAFVLPELLLDVLVASGLTAPFVPIYLGLRQDDETAADDFGRTVLTVATLVMAGCAAVLFVVAPWTASVIVPGFDAAHQALYVELFRIMCLTPILFAASIALGEVLVADRRFLTYGLAPLLYNGGIVLGTVLLSDRLGIKAAAVGAVLGAAAHLGIRLLGVLRAGFPVRARLAVRTAAFREFVRLMLPKMASQPIEPLTFLFYTAVATTIGAGAVSSVSFARNFQSVPVSLIGVSFSIAVFPALSSAWAAGERRRFAGLLATNVATIAALTIAAGIGLAVVGEVAIGVLLGGGAFDQAAIERTALVLSVFAISVPLESLTYPLARALYATRNTILQVAASVAGLAALVVACLALVDPLGIVAIPLSFAIGQAVKLVVLSLAIAARMRTGQPGGADSSGWVGTVGTTAM